MKLYAQKRYPITEKKQSYKQKLNMNFGIQISKWYIDLAIVFFSHVKINVINNNTLNLVP